MKKILKLAALAGFFFSNAGASQILQVIPGTFDFGWCPDNAKVSADFVIKNTGTDMVPLTAVQPTCGCTASEFTPGNLSTNDEKKIGLTFNTRGYANSAFNKNAKVKTDKSELEYTVHLKGHVTDPNAKVFPTGDGIAAFEPGASSKTKDITIVNKADGDVSLNIVQKPAEWAQVKLERNTVPPGGTLDLNVSVSGSLEEDRTTSVTLEALGQGNVHRFTVAVRTGKPPQPYRLPPPSQKPSGAQPQKSPAKK